MILLNDCVVLPVSGSVSELFVLTCTFFCYGVLFYGEELFEFISLRGIRINLHLCVESTRQGFSDCHEQF